MNKTTLTGLAAVALMATACQSGSYKINGIAQGLQDGDTLYLTSDMMSGIPSDTIIVRDKKFSLSGTADSTVFCMIYSADNSEQNATFFREPGTITVEIGQEPGAARVSGTAINNEWQRLNDSIQLFSQKISAIMAKSYDNNESEAQQQALMDDIGKLSNQLMSTIINVAERNIDNELGYFIVTNYEDGELFTPQKQQEFISKMPQHMRNRPAIKELEAYLKLAEKTGVGATVPDFTQSTPDGTDASLMAEIKKHKLTALDFWASWCGPCINMMPQMKALYERYQPAGFSIVGISLDRDRESWLNAINTLDLKWAQMSDLKYWDNEIARYFQVTSIPHVVLVDQQGTILARDLHGDELEQFVADYLK